MVLFNLAFIWLMLVGLTFPAGFDLDDVDIKKSISNMAFTKVADRVAFYDNIYPRCYYYNDVTYCTYHCELGQYDRCVMAYNHTQKKWAGPVKVALNPDTDKGDSHGNPAIIVANDGRILVVHAEHVSNYNVERSDSSENISAWSTETTIGSGHTYPQLFKTSTGTLYLISRQTGTEDDLVFYSSSDNGATWSAKTDIISAQLVDDSLVYSYGTLGSDDKLHVFMHYFKGVHGSPIFDTFPREDLYYMYRDTDGTWKDITGATLTLPLDRSDFGGNLLAFDSGGDHTYLKRPVVDSSGKPYCVFVQATVVDGSSPVSVNEIGTLKSTRWTGSAWSTATIVSSVRQISTIELRSSNLYIYSVNSARNVITRYTSTDSGATWSGGEVLYNLGQNNVIANVVTVDNGHVDARIVWYKFFSTLGNAAQIFLYGDGGYVAADGSLSN